MCLRKAPLGARDFACLSVLAPKPITKGPAICWRAKGRTLKGAAAKVAAGKKGLTGHDFFNASSTLLGLLPKAAAMSATLSSEPPPYC